MNPADTVHQWPIERLIPYARNSRTHSDAQVAQIAASIKEWGWTTPVLVDEDGQIIAGHGRIMAARKLGMIEVPVVIAKGWSDAQKRAYVIADNKLALNAGWDESILKLEFEELQSLDFDYQLTGFSEAEMTNLFLEKQEGITNPDEEWTGMPEFNQKDEQSFKRLIVHFDCQDDVNEFFSLIGQSHTDKTKFIWFPEKPPEDLASMGYIHDEE